MWSSREQGLRLAGTYSELFPMLAPGQREQLLNCLCHLQACEDSESRARIAFVLKSCCCYPRQRPIIALIQDGGEIFGVRVRVARLRYPDLTLDQNVSTSSSSDLYAVFRKPQCPTLPYSAHLPSALAHNTANQTPCEDGAQVIPLSLPSSSSQLII